MRISEISIEQFGAWRNLQLPLPSDGLNVLYGPNETGKSTLMRFVRGILYGYTGEDETGLGARPKRAACSGQLEIQDGADHYTLRRESKLGTRGQLKVTCNNSVVDPDEVLGRLLGESTNASQQLARQLASTTCRHSTPIRWPGASWATRSMPMC